MSKPVLCPKCDGNCVVRDVTVRGVAPDDLPWKQCPVCAGKGVLWVFEADPIVPALPYVPWHPPMWPVPWWTNQPQWTISTTNTQA